MAKIAVDVALLLPKPVNDVCIAINQAKDSVQTSDLSKPDNHPHITLAMGVIDEAQVVEVKERIKRLAARFHKLELEISGLRCPLNPDNKPS
ncbi:MAG: 2'-5' RNA ligase family protein, partial [Candidatus Micrarchaeota archaeon]